MAITSIRGENHLQLALEARECLWTNISLHRLENEIHIFGFARTVFRQFEDLKIGFRIPTLAPQSHVPVMGSLNVLGPTPRAVVGCMNGLLRKG